MFSDDKNNYNYEFYAQVSGVLQSDHAPLEKMRGLMYLGYDEEEAAQMVEQAEAGAKQATYYERLPAADYDARTNSSRD